MLQGLRSCCWEYRRLSWRTKNRLPAGQLRLRDHPGGRCQRLSRWHVPKISSPSIHRRCWCLARQSSCSRHSRTLWYHDRDMLLPEQPGMRTHRTSFQREYFLWLFLKWWMAPTQHRQLILLLLWCPSKSLSHPWLSVAKWSFQLRPSQQSLTSLMALVGSSSFRRWAYHNVPQVSAAAASSLDHQAVAGSLWLDSPNKLISYERRRMAASCVRLRPH